ncbi:MAG: SRPBCC domain-containing protein [Beutenbergiaceae bacterium]
MPIGTGYLRTTGDGLELVLTREFSIGQAEAWSWVTESAKLAQWIGHWSGQAGVGAVVEFTMGFEDSAEPEQVTIIECDPPQRLQVEFTSEAGIWHLQADVSGRGEGSVLQFNQLLDQGDDITTIGPGWEHYLDRLVAVLEQREPAPFSDYYPALLDYYRDLS